MTGRDKIVQLRKLIEQNPNDELANFGLGSALLEAGEDREAAACLQRVLAVNGRNSKAYQLLGEAQKRCGDTALAIQTLTNGCRVAQRQGDMMPMKAMAELLRELGAEAPSTEKPASEQPRPDGEGGFRCRRCGGMGPRLKQRPFKGPLGELILAGVCEACWKEWIAMGTRVINELQLPMHDPQAQEVYDREMKEFLMLE